MRQTQFFTPNNIDVKGELEDGALIVASCKCYAKIEKGEIAQWDTYCKEQRVQKFILAVTENDLHTVQRAVKAWRGEIAPTLLQGSAQALAGDSAVAATPVPAAAE